MSDEQNLHKGHRQRLLKKYLENGIQSLEEHEVLEVLLFFAFSRCNTNELSHKLINKFGSIKGVLTAPTEEITEINGIGDNSAMLLRFLGDFIDNFNYIKTPTVRLDSLETVFNFCQKYFPNNGKERCHLVLLDKRRFLLSWVNLPGQDFSTVDVELKPLFKKVLNVNASYVIIVHNHPDASSIASKNDVKYTRSIAAAFTPLNIGIIDHIVIGNDGCFSMRRENLLKDIWE